MNKYDRMLEKNRLRSLEKVRVAREEIAKMVRNNEEVSVGALAKRTGLSREFFYKNPSVREAVLSARRQMGDLSLQRSTASPLDLAAARLLDSTRAELEKEKKRNEVLSAENRRLRAALANRNRNLIRDI